MDFNNPAGEEHGMIPAPQTLAALIELSPLPAFEPDPRAPGRVILDKAWVQEHMVFEWFPLLGQRYVHRLLAGPLYAVMSEIAFSPYWTYIKPKQCGIFAPRRIGWKEGNRLSVHAIGLAVDINWNENPYGSSRTKIRDEYFWVVKVFEKHGFYWGGRWKTPDDMHFQYLPPTVRLPREHSNRLE